ncbi:MAG TPA: hypothetical protein VHL52_08575 [Acidimicrobiia bacterium]|nr:hypothetical protein [Acidimicrobiia bacterium]
MMSLMLTVSAVLAGLVFVVVGVFSLIALFMGDLLESEAAAATDTHLTEAA